MILIFISVIFYGLFVHVHLLTNSIHIYPVGDLFWWHFMFYSVNIASHFFYQFSISSTCLLLTLVGLSLHIFCLREPTCGDKFSTHLLFVTYSVHKELFDGLFYRHTSQYWPKSYKYHFFMTWFVIHLFMYTSNFHGLFCSFSSPRWTNFYLRDIFWPCARISADRFCT